MLDGPLLVILLHPSIVSGPVNAKSLLSFFSTFGWLLGMLRPLFAHELPPSSRLGLAVHRITVSMMPPSWSRSRGEAESQIRIRPLRKWTRALDPYVVLGQREVQEPIPVGVYLLGHRLLFSPVLARHLGRLGVPGLLRQALKELVSRYLHVLCCVGVSCVLARLIPAHHVGRALHQGGGYGLRLLASGGACSKGVQTLAQPRLLALGLLLVVL